MEDKGWAAEFDEAVSDYLGWMANSGYARTSLDNHRRSLAKFSRFILKSSLSWKDAFTPEVFKAFEAENKKDPGAFAVLALSRRLFEQGKIPKPLRRERFELSGVYGEYFEYYGKTRRAGESHTDKIRLTLKAFDDYLRRGKIKLSRLKIEQVDAFLGEHNKNLAENSARNYRSILKAFLSWLHQKKILRRDLAAFIVGAASYGRCKPPRFLRQDEVRLLLDAAGQLEPTARNLRDRAMLSLALLHGLRPKEISLISLDDIAFSKGELTVGIRKNDEPLILPLSEEALKTLAAYAVGGRPKSKYRRLFLSLAAPFAPIAAPCAAKSISRLVRGVNPNASAYWLRHTHAQNLLESGSSIFEVKEMLGHESIETTRRYLHIHLSLMRKVLFDETL